MPKVMKSGNPDAVEDFVEFVMAGVHVKGEFHCAECGYGVTIVRELPTCPMCGNESWEQTAWSPFARALRLQ
jgi:rubrerythrin